MKYVIIFILLAACNPFQKVNPQVGDCFIGQRMDVWKLMRAEDGKYMFGTYPLVEGSPVRILEDVSALKKVECPN